MNLQFNINLASSYKSNSQIIRVLTEDWVKNNSYCPKCGYEQLNDYVNNAPVADFYCQGCAEDFELKSKDGKLGLKVVDGAYSKMIERIQCDTNPNFFFLTYNKTLLTVNDLIVIPKHFFVPNIIIARKPLSSTAKRAGWIGCNIDLQQLPDLGKIFLIKQSKILEKEKVIQNYAKTIFLHTETIESKGWLLDIMQCIEKIEGQSFTLSDIYKFENDLKLRHPNNNHIKDKIRQQLQKLRDLNIIEFTVRGNYTKI